MFKRSKILVAVCFVIFLFWFLLAKNNFFHMDDWEWVKLYEKGFWPMIMTPRDQEHFVPLGGMVFYVLFTLFGFSYIPFQIVNSLVHALNALLVYKIVRYETKDGKLSLMAALLFGFISTAPDVLVWANSFLINTAGLFYFLGYYCFLLYTQKKKTGYLIVSALSLVAGPRFQTITTIAPLAVAAAAYLRLKKKDVKIPVATYILVSFVNIAITFASSPGSLAGKTQQISPSLWSQIPVYIFWGIYKGTFLRLLTPDLYFLKNITHITQPVRILAAIFLPVAAFFAFGQIQINKRLLQKQNTNVYISYIILLAITYIMIAPFRVHNGIMQATIPRYTYTSVFFMIILFSIMYHSLYRKIGRVVTAGFIVLLLLHIVADYNFNANWHLNTEKDKQFTEDMRYLFRHNTDVYDFPLDGIWVLKVSDIDTLLAPGARVTFHPLPFDTNSPYYQLSDDRTKRIYEKLQTDYAVYNPPFHVPYSM